MSAPPDRQNENTPTGPTAEVLEKSTIDVDALHIVEQVNSKVQPMTAHLQTLKAPAPLRSLPGWLIWRYEHAQGETKARKIPYYASGARRFGIQGSPKDRMALVSFDVAKKTAAMRGFDGVGLALLGEFGITALDYDDCVGPHGLDANVEAMVAGTYAEYSPSGKGVRAFVTGHLGNKKSFANATQYGFETFSDKGFVTFTGIPLDITELTGSENVVNEPSTAVLALHANRFEKDSSNRTDGEGYSAECEPIIGLTEEQINQCMAVLDPNMGHDDWLHIGMGLHHETCGDGFEVWNDWSATGAGYPGRETLESRWLSFGQSNAGRPVTARSLVRKANEAGAGLAIDVAAVSEFSIIPEPLAPVGGHFPIMSVADFMAEDKPVKWFIKGVFQRGEMAIIFGESASGKTFLMLDMCCAIARGTPWNGQDTHRSRVLYVVAEGVSGFRRRLKAYCHQQGITAAELGIDIMYVRTPNLLDTPQIKELCKELQAREGYDLVVLDTLAQVTPGANENSGEDMGKALANGKAIGRAAGGAMICYVAHSGKDASRGVRGWSGLRPAAEVVLEVTRFEEDRVLFVDKLKDGEDGAQFGFKLLTVTLGVDSDGEDITSCVVEYCAAKVLRKAKKEPQPGINEKIVLRVAHDLAGFAADGKVPQTDLIDAAVAQLLHSGLGKDQRPKRVKVAIESLTAKGALHIGIDAGGSFLRIPADSNAQ